jgi:hypothetical protein
MQALTLVGQPVLDPWRHYGKDLSMQNPVCLRFPQLFGQTALGDVADTLQQILSLTHLRAAFYGEFRD